MSADVISQSFQETFAAPSDCVTAPHWRERRRRNILAAAESLFARSSYDAVQMDDIARQAGVGKPTIYRYFVSKDELFLEVFRTALQKLQQRLSEILVADLRPAAALDATIRISFAMLGNQVSALRLLTDGQPDLIIRWRGEFDRYRLFLVSTFRTIIDRGIECGDFRAVDLEVIPPVLVGMIRGGLMSVDTVNGRSKMTTAAIDLVLAGLRQHP
jgi:AcrR family transcriptional regulator